jgi:prostaglandin-endoperoxide synthase 2
MNPQTYILTHFGGFWRFVQTIPWLRRKVNRFLINSSIDRTATRPYPFSTLNPYTSWESLTDRTYSNRHLPAVEQPPNLPDTNTLADLFMRRGETILCPKSTVLFAYFAQWFTDGFLRTDGNNPGKNTSNHEIDLTPLYGVNKPVTEIVRAQHGGLLKSQMINGEEYPPHLCENGVVKTEFAGLKQVQFGDRSPEEKNQFFAMAGDRSNVQIGYVLLNVLFLREHNRIAGLLAREYPAWDDERIFQTARNIVIVILMRIVIEEYINHITPLQFPFFLDPGAFPNERWYRQNWMAVEFTLVYRWHMLIPDKLTVAGASVDPSTTMWNTSLITNRGLGALFEEASRQPAGKVGLFNSPKFLREIEVRSIQMGRDLHLASYNDYRATYKMPRVTDFSEISSNPTVQSELKRLYGNVDRIDYYIGLFAEDTVPNSVLSPLIGTLVAIDAFSQALTNPLLNPNIYNQRTFSPLGMELIEKTSRLTDVLHRNIPADSRKYYVSLTREDWKRV